VSVDPVVASTPIELGMEPRLRRRLPELAHGRPLVIDYYTSRHCGLTIGDLTVRFATRALQPRYVELLPIEGVRILAERHIVKLLADGATLHQAALPFGDRLAISLAHPERWIEFLDRSPIRRH